ncbi:hypothetical protein SAMN04487948_1309 [Halogranum amylolyticum]|uniref:Uncharacterized protein n=1 Tax=Halogranum amylolyticum TaxID=660520 RepID=A0A1H8WHC5_9EURY|nr:hypothetical protein SAMN04487948_1309 [Halogranum amylolyticum]
MLIILLNRDKTGKGMAGKSQSTMEVTCNKCAFTQVVNPGDEVLPSEVVVEHGKQTGHKLTVAALVK